MSDKQEANGSEGDRIRKLVKGPAMGLNIAGAIAVFTGAMGLIDMTETQEPESTDTGQGAEPQGDPSSLDGVIEFFDWLAGPGQALFVGILLLQLAIGGFAIYGSACFRKLEKHGLVKAAAWSVMIPLWCNFLIGLPIGIWVLSILRRPDVKGAFAASD